MERRGRWAGERKKDGQHMDKQQGKAVQKCKRCRCMLFAIDVPRSLCSNAVFLRIYILFILRGGRQKYITFYFLLQPNQDTQASGHPTLEHVHRPSIKSSEGYRAVSIPPLQHYTFHECRTETSIYIKSMRHRHEDRSTCRCARTRHNGLPETKQMAAPRIHSIAALNRISTPALNFHLPPAAISQ